MYHFCTKCHQVYLPGFEEIHTSNRPNNPYHIRLCPKVGCQGAVVEIDELIMPAIEQFNKAGYETEFCCSGHPHDPRAYVSFTKFYHLPKEHFPNSWYQDKDWGTLRAKEIDSKATIEETIDYIAKINKELYLYAKELADDLTKS